MNKNKLIYIIGYLVLRLLACVDYYHITIGKKSVSGKRPIIGDNVMIYAGSKILGDITIGNSCIIGANSVVLQSFPDNSVIAGIPAKNIKG